MHHLQIMEALGGDALWIDRFLAQHGAILYYWVLVGFYLLFPNLAYNFSELVESHASDTYAVFVDVRAFYKRLPAIIPAICTHACEACVPFVGYLSCCWQVMDFMTAMPGSVADSAKPSPGCATQRNLMKRRHCGALRGAGQRGAAEGAATAAGGAGVLQGRRPVHVRRLPDHLAA